MAKGKATWIWLSVAFIGAILALAWPSIEQQLRVSGVPCPWPFTLFHAKHGDTASAAAPVGASQLTKFTLEELAKYDGSDKSLPILLAIGGKVVDVTQGEKFYGPGKMYHQFAGRACTRALTLSSLDKNDISDDVSDFDDKQKQEMEETTLFYYDKYPVVGVLV
uniref:Cytochrome b5 heme-binding domain-containing protein n=1 Tax=Globisporangium ultimum (strain ATCC 200006 / CBS 805.95 / DAOM BR144) TaxID=431595 RepID=K3XCD2_GLOUD